MTNEASWEKTMRSSPARLPILLSLALLLGFPPTWAQPEEEATPVQVDPVRRQTMTQTVPVIGRLVSLQVGEVAARTAGPVARLAVQVGDQVERGQVLVELDQARLQARVEQQQAELAELQARKATAEANLRLARLELRRLEQLRGSPAFNRSLYDTRNQELAVARSALGEAEARISRGRVTLELARIERADATIRAPFPGTVSLRHTSEGAWLGVGDPVVTLIDDLHLEIEADVPAERLGGLRPGTRVAVNLADGSRHQALVRAVIPDEDPAARTRPVRFVPEFRTLQSALARNQSVTLELPAGAADEVVSVHKDAILHQGGGTLVYVVDGEQAQPRAVSLGEAVGERMRVLEGLEPGELVVVRGNERLRPGQRVSFEPPAEIIGMAGGG